MCRFLAWMGAPRFLDELVLNEEQSLIEQSRNALTGKTPVNADGFGLAWYNERRTPCFYKDTHPAWSDANLKQLAHHTKAKLFLAHVRASTGMATSRNNCHPFGVKEWSFMHNGQAGGHEKFRQKLENLIPADLYGQRFGATESEAIFLIALGEGLDQDPIGAMARAVHKVETLAHKEGEKPFMRFAACWSNGEHLFAARHASDCFAPSLYFQECSNGIVIASEPLSSDKHGWTEVNAGEAIKITNDRVTRYNFEPSQIEEPHL